MLTILRDLITGFCIGVANIIPGVSGGTFLLVFGIFERVMGALDTLKEGFIDELKVVAIALPGLPFSSSSRATVLAWLQKHDFLFLSRILVGAAAAIVVLSGIMKYLLASHFSNTYSFFLGLIVLSIVVPIRLVKSWRIPLALPLLAGLILTVYVTAAVNPADKARTKSAHYQMQFENQQQQGTGSAVMTYTPGDYVYAVVCGAVAVSTMALPGISGSLVLILMGEYHVVLSAISDLKLPSGEAALFLACFSIGLGAGILLFAKAINWVLARWHDMTMAFLLGLMLGSLWALWPFKAVEHADLYQKSHGVIEFVQGAIVQTNRNIVPDSGDILLPLLFFAVGCAVMAVFSLRGEAGQTTPAR